ncbi:membrane protein [Candidatus Bathyarchaeota archaeon]|nr:membrane protein [Candidatus Bathyarchaeota archaeon]
MQTKLTDKWRSFLIRLPSLYFGLFLFALGAVMILYADLGMSPWGVFQVGLMNSVGLTFGQASQVVGLGVLVLGWLLGFPPGFGTVMNMYFIGYFIDRIIKWGIVPRFNNLGMQLVLLVGGMVMIGVASYFYLRPKLGAGPRDGLMIGLVQKLDRPVGQVRGGIEVTVTVLGYLMGGPIGLGTVITALSIGYFVQLAFKLGNYDRNAKHMNLYELAKYLSISQS